MSHHTMSSTIAQPSPAAIVAEARSWIGTPYHHQASVKGVGCDCLGLVRGVWRAFYGPEPELLPAYTSDWGEVAGDEPMLAAARRHLVETEPTAALRGDVLVFRIRPGRVAKHAAILAGDLTVNDWRMVHAQEGVPVSEVWMSDWWWDRIVAAFRFPGVS